MGSWDATCHLSGLPIKYGEKVVVIPLIESNGIESTKQYYDFYPNSNYEPLTPPIYGTYDDYGSIEGETLEKDNEIIMKCINSIKFYDAKADYEDDEIKFESIYDFISKLERGDCGETDIQIKRFGYRHRVKFVMYLADIYNGLLNAWKKDKPFDELEEILTSHFEKVNSPTYDRWLDRENKIERKFWWIKNSLLLNYYKGFAECQKEFVKRLVETEVFTSILGHLRRGYMCITGCGSQSVNYELHFLLQGLIGQHIVNQMKKRLSEWCDDEEFDKKYDLENNEITDEIAIEYIKKHATDVC